MLTRVGRLITLAFFAVTGFMLNHPDWFDLGIDITVEGSKVPFTELFVALANGQSHLLLSDGAYFSLDLFFFVGLYFLNYLHYRTQLKLGENSQTPAPAVQRSG